MSPGRVAVDLRTAVRFVWSLGWLSVRQYTELADCGYQYGSNRLYQLSRRQVLDRTYPPMYSVGTRWLYTLGPRIDLVAPELAGAWRPPLEQALHTLLVGDLVIAMVRRGRPPVRRWAGEPELRAWQEPGEPLPDALVEWDRAGRRGRFFLEADRGTESHAVWRRKLAGYRGRLAAADTVLVGTTGLDRARRIAQAASDAGVPLLAGVNAELIASDEPAVLDSLTRRRRLLSSCADAD